MTKSTTKKKDAGIELGSLVKDYITGFTGIAIGRTEFAFGCIHIRIQAQGLTKECTPIPPQSFDDQRIEVIEPPKRSWRQPKRPLIEQGNTVRDLLTGAVGVVSGINFNLSGEINILIEQAGLTQDGSPKSPYYATPDQLIIVDRRELKVSQDSLASKGGPVSREALPR